MLPPTDDTCDESCRMPLRPRALLSFHSLGTLGSALFFILTFLIVSYLVARHLFPLLAGAASRVDDDYYLPSDAPPALKEAEAKHNTWPLRRRLAAVSFGATIALAAVLAELILCEISSSLDPDARALALRVTVPALLVLLVLWIPFLEIQSVIRGAGWDFINRRDGRLNKIPCILQGLSFAIWIFIFWFSGDFSSTASSFDDMLAPALTPSLSDAALSRVGVVGVSLMALLSGFASVSSPWQAFFQRSKPVTDSDLARKATGLDATNDLLAAKKSRLRALNHKLSDAPEEGFMTRVLGTIRGNADATEVKALQLEISGLETMASAGKARRRLTRPGRLGAPNLLPPRRHHALAVLQLRPTDPARLLALCSRLGAAGSGQLTVGGCADQRYVCDQRRAVVEEQFAGGGGEWDWAGVGEGGGCWVCGEVV
ncbi:hypothetical protein V496_03573 [Pseudogymnoascus sp. VKM F-4515 (FW-2607)]|nr:hypothetical protein V496_03573 [Pseudogymnoascus sp. VKM F-4515 (FW-2607)]